MSAPCRGPSRRDEGVDRSVSGRRRWPRRASAPGLTIDPGRRPDPLIRRTLVEDIEADDYHSCGGDFYARGHIKHDRPRGRASIPRRCSPSSTRAPRARPADRRRRPRHRSARRPRPRGAAPTQLVGRHGRRARRSWSASAPCSCGRRRRRRSRATAPRASSTAARLGRVAERRATASVDGVRPADAGARSDAIAAAPRRVCTVMLIAPSTAAAGSAPPARTASVSSRACSRTARSKTFTRRPQVKLVIGNAGAVTLVVNGSDLGCAGRRRARSSG